MKIDIATHASMSESGSSLLRLIQSQDTPLLDLLVRESIQNSLDAWDPATGRKYVRVDISRTIFKSSDLNPFFEGISKALDHRFPKGKYSSLIFADRGTTGLTGPLTYADITNANDYGNLIKLVYEIGKNQTNEGAGGSWGLGKTVFFRAGIGLVIYYSRIKLSKRKYESRLVACLVENEKSESSMIPDTEPLRRGIAWWGDDKGRLGRKRPVPLTKESEINKLLNVFGFKPYQDDETGTAIIIPYIDEDSLLKEAGSGGNGDSYSDPPWMRNIEEYLNVAVQRWYGPRLNNPDYNGAYLNAWVGGKQILPTHMYPFFRIIRELYVMQMKGTLPPDSYLKDVKADPLLEQIRVRSILTKSTAGQFCFVRLSAEQLKMAPPDNQFSPYALISNYEPEMGQGNVPVVMYTRKPAMIVNYDYGGPWTSGMPRTDKDTWIVGLFTANSANTFVSLTNPETGNLMSVEEYIRQSEKADHAAWGDKSYNNQNPRLIRKIQNQVNNRVMKTFGSVTTDQGPRTNLGLAHALANLLLPPEGFGSQSSVPVRSTKTPGQSGSIGSGTDRLPFIIEDGVRSFPEGMGIPFTCSLKQGESCKICLQIFTDYKKYDAENWEDPAQAGLAFPAEFWGVKIESAREPGKKGPPYKRTDSHSASEEKVVTEDAEIQFETTSLYHTKASMILSSRNGWILHGWFIVNTHDPSIRLSIGVRRAQ